MNDWQLVVAGIALLLSIFQIIYFFGYWRGKITVMLNLLWKIYVEDALTKRPDLAIHQSPFHLSKEAKEEIPEEIKFKVAEIKSRLKSKEDECSGFTIANELGMPLLVKTAKTMGLGIQETIAVLSTYLQELP